MRKYLFLLAILLSIAFISCKKTSDDIVDVDEEQEQPVEPQDTTTPCIGPYHDCDNDGICDVGWMGDSCNIEYRSLFTGRYQDDLSFFESVNFRIVSNPDNILELLMAQDDGSLTGQKMCFSTAMNDTFTVPLVYVSNYWMYGGGYFYGTEKDSFYLQLHVLQTDSSWQTQSAKPWAYRVD